MKQASLLVFFVIILSSCMKETTDTPDSSVELPVAVEQTEDSDNDDSVGSGEVDLKEKGVEIAKRDSIDQQIEELRRELNDAEIVRLGNEIKITLNSKILFDVDSDEIDPAAKSTLKELANILSKYKGTSIEVAGHTDNSGSREYNKDLSKRRASSVARYTVSQGVSPLRFKIRGFGEGAPVASNNTKEGRSRNRRVEISIKGNKKLNPGIAKVFKQADDSSCFCTYDDYKNYVCRRLCDSWMKLPASALSFESDFFDKPARIDELLASTTRENGDKLYHIGGSNFYARQDIGKKLEENNAIIMVGKVKDILNNEPTGAKIEVKDMETGEVVAELEADAVSGGYSILLERGKHYSLSVKKDGYLISNENISIPEMQGYTVIKQNMQMTPIEEGQKLKLKNVFFEQSKAKLLDASYEELHDVYTLLHDNPTLKIELHGHTDGIGDPDLNFKLSEDRVETIKTWLSEKGIQDSRISTKAFGGTKPIASNEREETRKLNRRVEFLVTDF